MGERQSIPDGPTQKTVLSRRNVLGLAAVTAIGALGFGTKKAVQEIMEEQPTEQRDIERHTLRISLDFDRKTSKQTIEKALLPVRLYGITVKEMEEKYGIRIHSKPEMKPDGVTYDKTSGISHDGTFISDQFLPETKEIDIRVERDGQLAISFVSKNPDDDARKEETVRVDAKTGVKTLQQTEFSEPFAKTKSRLNRLLGL